MTGKQVLHGLDVHGPRVVAIGGSAGALEALRQVLPALPPTFPAVIVMVVHLPPERESGLAAAIAADCALAVCEPDDKTPAKRGCIYVAPADYHLLMETDGSLALSSDPPVHFSRPSIDVLFQSVADACGRRAMGILLSGANEDGAEGLAAIRAVGGLTWVQMPADAAVSVMPEAALARAPHAVLTPADMGQALADWGRTGE